MHSPRTYCIDTHATPDRLRQGEIHTYDEAFTLAMGMNHSDIFHDRIADLISTAFSDQLEEAEAKQFDRLMQLQQHFRDVYMNHAPGTPLLPLDNILKDEWLGILKPSQEVAHLQN